MVYREEFVLSRHSQRGAYPIGTHRGIWIPADPTDYYPPIYIFKTGGVLVAFNAKMAKVHKRNLAHRAFISDDFSAAARYAEKFNDGKFITDDGFEPKRLAEFDRLMKDF